MSVLIVVIGAGVILFISYLTYGKFLSKKVFVLDDTKVTPSVELNDGQDYVPAKKSMLLGQHFSAIAAAGPINGPILASVMFGWLPAMLWVLIGSIFIGGVHDMGSLVASVRNKARSITEVMKLHVSSRAWILFMIFIWVALVYVIIAFTDITASSFVGIVTLESGERVNGGAVASSSVMYLILPIIMALLMKFGKMKEWLSLVIFLPLVGVAIWAGQFIPLNLPIADPASAQKIWGVIILVYCVVASLLPMWLLLQPRGTLGGYFLYASLLIAAVGLIFGGYSINYPAFINFGADGSMGSSFWFPMFPILFITIACGACSGFHALVSSGTTSKQLRKESDAKPIGYGAMLLEGMVAVVSIAFVMILTRDSDMIKRAPNFIYAAGIGRFMEILGISATFGITFGLMAFTTFVYDTLDVCTRLGRYIIEELTGLKGWAGKLVGTLLTAGVPVFFIFQTMTDSKGNSIPAWKIFWSTFGASNQLLAALALVAVTIWLMHTRKGSKVWLVAFIPAVIMFVMSNWALVIAVYNGWVLKTTHPSIPWVSLFLIILSVLVAIETISSYIRSRKSI
ncbi:MAG: carbon starvation protein CstA [Bacteroidetes bacterium GWF2_41_61]|nr:MAG: carbon starvation protein CstA [Bacteroidetes bacterium GWE2_40_15]OFY31136.1 MAG: carbon starvation protein CstA [Bacteroidetes bacterium GWF2_41_61]HBG24295.1 carbon starvation protein A [Rikenellaceae bacterium]HBZ26663.1 carbon starvation protein A [Rikenellaceae bacterium]